MRLECIIPYTVFFLAAADRDSTARHSFHSHRSIYYLWIFGASTSCLSAYPSFALFPLASRGFTHNTIAENKKTTNFVSHLARCCFGLCASREFFFIFVNRDHSTLVVDRARVPKQERKTVFYRNVSDVNERCNACMYVRAMRMRIGKNSRYLTVNITEKNIYEYLFCSFVRLVPSYFGYCYCCWLLALFFLVLLSIRLLSGGATCGFFDGGGSKIFDKHKIAWMTRRDGFRVSWLAFAVKWRKKRYTHVCCVVCVWCTCLDNFFFQRICDDRILSWDCSGIFYCGFDGCSKSTWWILNWPWSTVER